MGATDQGVQKQEPSKSEEKKKRVYQLIMAIAGTVLTWLVWNPNKTTGYSGISNIIASAGLGLIAGVLFKKHFDIFYSGTFAGMCSAAVIPAIYWAILLGVVVFAVWVALEKLFAGVGGKFGTIAMISGLIVATIVLIVQGATYKHPIASGVANYKQLNWIIWLCTPLLTAAACTATLFVRNKGELAKNTTVASAIVGLLGAFLLLLITSKVPTSTTVSYGTVFAGAVYSASFAGMASKDRLKTYDMYSEYVAFAITGLIVGFIYLGIFGILMVGGKFGFSGFLSVLVYNKGICKLLEKKKAA